MSMSNIISIVSGKGGVGKTTFSVNLAAALNEFSRDNTVVDVDVGNPNLALHLGLQHTPLAIQDVLNGDAKIHHTIHVHPTGLRVIPASLSAKKSTADFSKLGKILGELQGIVLLDSPPGSGKDIVPILDSSDTIIVITNPEVSAVTDAAKLIKLAKDMKKEKIGVVINRVRDDFFELTSDEVEIMCEAPIISRIPEDSNIRKAVFENLPVLHRNPYSNAAIAFRYLAARLIGEEYVPPTFLFLRRILNR